MESRFEALMHYANDLPLFPLPQMVFFTHTVLPLHIFEPRYRDMVRDVQKHGWPIVMGNIDVSAGLDDQGRPRVLPIAGVGFISRCEELPDGRFLIELEGSSRVRITHEHSAGRDYRTVAVEVLDSDDVDPQALEQARHSIQVLVMGLTQQNARVGEYLQYLIRKASDASALADSMAASLITDPAARQALLENVDVLSRLDAVVTRMAELMALAARPDSTTKFN